MKLTRVLLVMLIFASVACTKKKRGLEYGLDVKDTIRANFLTEPPTLDWNLITDTTSMQVVNNLMDGLVGYDLYDPNLKTIPVLATEWSPSADAKTWTFTLRKGVKWTDGVEFTGQQVIDSWERLLNSKTASEAAYYLFDIKNAKAYNSGKVKDFKEVGVRLNDKGQLVVELESPKSYFPVLLTNAVTFPIRKDLIEKFGVQWTVPGNMQTLGAYKLKVWDHDKNLVLERYDNYFGEKAKVKNVLIYLINEYSTALNLAEAGRLDFQDSLPFKEIPKLRNKPGFRMIKTLMIGYYGFNTRKPPFNDSKVRRAFGTAINRDELVKLMGSDYKPLTGWFPSGMLGFDKDRGPKFDPEKARQLLDEAGYKDRAKFPSITLAFNTMETNQVVAENVQAQIKRNLGIQVQLSHEEWKTYLKRLQNDTPDIYRFAYVADFPDPANFASLMTSYSDNNNTGWKNKKYDELENEAAASLDPAKRQALYSELSKLLTEDEAPVLPLYDGAWYVLLSDRLDHFPANGMQIWNFKGATFK